MWIIVLHDSTGGNNGLLSVIVLCAGGGELFYFYFLTFDLKFQKKYDSKNSERKAKTHALSTLTVFIKILTVICLHFLSWRSGQSFPLSL